MKLFAFAENANFNFVGQRYLAFAVTAIMIFGSIALFAVKGLNYGIDFTGGVMMEVRTPETPDLARMRSELNALDLGAVSIQEFGEPTDLLIRVPEQQPGGNAEQQQALAKVQDVINAEFAGTKPEFRRTEFVGPQVGDELKAKGAWAFGLTILAILGYIWYRYEWQFGLTAIITLIHDMLAVVGLFSFFEFQFDLAALAAVLMVAGYSTNDTVIVFDRIRENRRKFKKMPMLELINLCINQTLSRTLMTSLTTILALVALWAFGGAVIRDFTVAMLFGVIVGTYSSIYVSSSALLYLPFRDSDKRDPDDVKAESLMDVTPLIQSGQKIIQAYAAGRIKISGEYFDHPVIVTPFSVEGWNYDAGKGLVVADFASLSGQVDVLLIGLGKTAAPLFPAERGAFSKAGLSVDVMDTPAACRTFNVLTTEGRRVAAALVPL